MCGAASPNMTWCSTCVYICLYLPLSLSIYIYIYIYTYTWLYTYIYIYIYIYNHNDNSNMNDNDTNNTNGGYKHHCVSLWAAGLWKLHQPCAMLLGALSVRKPLGFPKVQGFSHQEHTCHILPFQPILWNRCFPSKSVKSAQNSPNSISEGGRIWRVWRRLSMTFLPRFEVQGFSHQ